MDHYLGLFNTPSIYALTFGPNEKHMGIIEFDKKHKVFNVLEKVDDGIVSNEAYENWTAEKIVKLIYKNGANLPDITSVEK